MMYLISYDLMQPSQNYLMLTTELEILGADPILQSVWILRAENTTAEELFSRLRSLIDASDRLFVCRLSSERGARWQNLLTDLDRI